MIRGRASPSDAASRAARRQWVLGTFAVVATVTSIAILMWVASLPITAVFAQDQTPTAAEPAPPDMPAKKAKPAARPAPAAAAPQVQMPNASQIVLLIRMSVMALGDALQTGNFTVLRDLGAPGFAEANTAAKLSQTFAGLAAQGIDLTSTSIIAPQLTETPTLDPKTGMLHIKGFFPGQPVQINFELLFQPVGGRWRIFGMSVNPAAAAAVTEAPAAEPAGPVKAP